MKAKKFRYGNIQSYVAQDKIRREKLHALAVIAFGPNVEIEGETNDLIEYRYVGKGPVRSWWRRFWFDATKEP